MFTAFNALCISREPCAGWSSIPWGSILYNLQSHLILGWPVLDFEFLAHIFGASSTQLECEWFPRQNETFPDMCETSNNWKKWPEPRDEDLCGGIARAGQWRPDPWLILHATVTALWQIAAEPFSGLDSEIQIDYSAPFSHVSFFTIYFKKGGFVPFSCNELKLRRHCKSDDTLSI